MIESLFPASAVGLFDFASGQFDWLAGLVIFYLTSTYFYFLMDNVLSFLGRNPLDG